MRRTGEDKSDSVREPSRGTAANSSAGFAARTSRRKSRGAIETALKAYAAPRRSMATKPELMGCQIDDHSTHATGPDQRPDRVPYR
jgi:hypothetical protein